jgi:hypothetical protein
MVQQPPAVKTKQIHTKNQEPIKSGSKVIVVLNVFCMTTAQVTHNQTVE